MSKIVDRVITIPETVDLKYDEKLRSLSISGPNGSFSINVHSSVNLSIEENSVKTSYLDNTDRSSKALTGTANSLIFNAINGSLKDHKKVLEIKGVGYRALISEKTIIVSAGYSHEVKVEIPSDIKVECLNGTRVIVRSCDKQKVG